MERQKMSQKFHKNLIKDLVNQTLQRDIDPIVSRLQTVIDNNVIDQKFQEGFPGHENTPSTIKKKGSNKVGTDTGKLREAATLWNNWTVYPFRESSTVRPLARKEKHGLTDYSDYVRTKVGGLLDFLALESKDIASLEIDIRKEFGKRQYKGTGIVKVIRK